MWTTLRNLAHAINIVAFVGILAWNNSEGRLNEERLTDGIGVFVFTAIGIHIGFAMIGWLGKSSARAAHTTAAKVDRVTHEMQERVNAGHDARDNAYRSVSRELEEGRIDEALWLQAFERAGGDKDRQRALYVKLRVRSVVREDSS